MAASIEIDGSEDHFETVAQVLREDFVGLRELADVQLRFKDGSVPVHSAMLAAFSSNFARKFVGGKRGDVDLSFLNKESAEKVLDYIYNGRVSLRYGSLQNDLEAIAYFGVSKLQEDVEKIMIGMAKRGKCVDVLNIVTANLKSIPHSPSTMLAASDQTVCDLVGLLHDMFVTNYLPYEEILKLSTNTIVTMLSARIEDDKKVQIINMALKWIYERRLSDRKASNILRALTIGSLTYSQLVQFRNSLIQTAVPVTIGRCVRLKKADDNMFDIVFSYAENSGHQVLHKPLTPTTHSFSTVLTDPTIRFASPSVPSSSHTRFEVPTSRLSNSSDFGIDDCSTAMSFDSDDLKRLGYENPAKK
ncbi:unnamed protein product [Caenorhabditis sp. 36 PRJEB53466]|nr:unnamed protein product [Caenorhabditis sp. 36 PRJEB53466]